MRRFGAWACLTLLSFGVAASCGSSEEKHAVAAGGDDQGGDAGASAGRAGSAGSAGNAGSVGTAGALASGGEAGNAGSMPSAGAGNDAAGQGGASGQGGNEPIAGNGGASGPGGAGGAGGAACCSTSSYQASSQLLPNAVCSGWELVNGADTELPQLPGGYLRLSTSTVAENQYYKVAPEGLKAPTKLVIEARMQLISGSASAAYRAPANFGFVLDGKKNLLMIADGEIFILSAENTKGTSAAVATTDAMHVYRMEVDTALGTVEVFYDGVSKLTGSTFADPNGTPNFLYFGDGSLFGTGVSDWAYFTHNADACAD